MQAIHGFYAGTVSKQNVLKTSRVGENRFTGKPVRGKRQSDLDGQTFYAHFYLALYGELLGHTEKSLAHIKIAVRFAPAHYLGDVSRVHLKLRSTKN